MKYKKIRIEYISDTINKTKDKIIDILKEMGIYELELIDEFIDDKLDFLDNFKYKNDTYNIIFYLVDNKYIDKKIEMILSNLDNILDENFVYEIKISNYDTETYKDEWKKYFKTTKIHDNIVIKPSWNDYENTSNDEIIIEIDPGIAFGTGTHETTSLCLKQMYNLLKNKDNSNKSLIDIGTGSGILMILARKLGVSKITGIDIDPKVEKVVIENLSKNNIFDNFYVKIGNLVEKIDEKYDYVVSNILVDVLEELLKDIKKISHKDTVFIFSGILNSKSYQFLEKAKIYGLYPINTELKNDWVSFTMKIEEQNIIAIDGPAGSGKSTIAQEISKKIGYYYLNTGAMYRVYAYKLKKENINLKNKEDIEQFINKLNIEIKDDKFYLDNEDITEKIRNEEIGNIASKIVSINKNIRKYMVDIQRKISENKKVILDGRDIGSIVFPNAKLKIFLTASVDKRANRRYLELLNKGIDISYEEVLEDIKKRDYSDINRVESPLIKTYDAIEIDTTNKNIEEVINEIINLARIREMI